MSRRGPLRGLVSGLRESVEVARTRLEGARERLNAARERLADYGALVSDREQMTRTLGRQLLGPLLTDPRAEPTEPSAAVLRRLHPGALRCRVSGRRRETPSTCTFRLTPLEGAFPPFYAGQYVNLFCEVAGVRTSRPYSIASPPTRLGNIDLTVKAKEGGFVSPLLVRHLAVGDELELTGPAGSFYYSPLRDTRELVFLAGGSGIAPFLGIVEDLLDRGEPVRMLLLFGARTPEELIARERLDNFAAEHPSQFRVVYVISDAVADWEGERGFLDAACLRRHLDPEDLSQQTFFVCGPPAMYALVRRELDALGVPPHRIRMEAFGPPEDITASPGWPREISPDATFTVTVEPSGQTLSARAGEPLMCSLERAGLAIPALCRSGVCATCRTQLVAGSVYSPDDAALRETDIRAGFIHPCLAYPTSDLVLHLP